MKGIPESKIYFHYSKMISEKFHNDCYKNCFFQITHFKINSGYKTLNIKKILSNHNFSERIQFLLAFFHYFKNKFTSKFNSSLMPKVTTSPDNSISFYF